MRVIACGRTDVGRIRDSNEDSYGIYPELNLYIVADGMGGHAAGEVASKIAVDSISAFISSDKDDEEDGPDVKAMRLKDAIRSANSHIFEAGKNDPHLTGMGTTVVSLLIDLDKDTGYMAHVGDSRAYIIRGGEIEQLTSDHSLVMDYVRKGIITQEEAETHPYRHVLSRALGTDYYIEVDLRKISICPHDIFLLCSDGLSNMIDRDEMLNIITNNYGGIEDASDELVVVANDRGGEDNITVVIVRCME